MTAVAALAQLAVIQSQRLKQQAVAEDSPTNRGAIAVGRFFQIDGAWVVLLHQAALILVMVVSERDVR